MVNELVVALPSSLSVQVLDYVEHLHDTHTHTDGRLRRSGFSCDFVAAPAILLLATQ